MNYLKLVICRTYDRCHYISLKHLKYPFEVSGAPLGYLGIQFGNPIFVPVHMLPMLGKFLFFLFIPKNDMKSFLSNEFQACGNRQEGWWRIVRTFLKKGKLIMFKESLL